MRRAGWLLCLWWVAACGGAAPVGNAGPDGGGNVVVPDGGGNGPPDAGPSADCEGLVPDAPRTAFTFDVVPSDSTDTCEATAIDGEGVVAAWARNSATTIWYEFAPNYGARYGSFSAPG